MKLSLVFAAVCVLAMTGTAVAKNINFVNRCDGMDITVSDDKRAAEVRTGCFDGIGTGAVGKATYLERTGKWLIITTVPSDVPDGRSITYIIQYPLRNDGVWQNFYSTDGVTLKTLHSGTYQLGKPRRIGNAANSSTSAP
jgi:hypothetical protein